jgi:hypothetical protein
VGVDHDSSGVGVTVGRGSNSGGMYLSAVVRIPVPYCILVLAKALQRMAMHLAKESDRALNVVSYGYADILGNQYWYLKLEKSKLI